MSIFKVWTSNSHVNQDLPQKITSWTFYLSSYHCLFFFYFSEVVPGASPLSNVLALLLLTIALWPFFVCTPRQAWSCICGGCQPKGGRGGPPLNFPLSLPSTCSSLMSCSRASSGQMSRSVCYSFRLCLDLPARRLSLLEIPWKIRCGSWMWLKLTTAYKILLRQSKSVIRVVFITDLTLGKWSVGGRKKFSVHQLSAARRLWLLCFTGQFPSAKGSVGKQEGISWATQL